MGLCKERDLTIITKDTDFRNKILISEPPPKIIIIRIGNLRLKDFHDLISKSWKEILEFNNHYKLVVVYPDRIEGIKSNPT